MIFLLHLSLNELVALNTGIFIEISSLSKFLAIKPLVQPRIRFH